MIGTIVAVSPALRPSALAGGRMMTGMLAAAACLSAGAAGSVAAEGRLRADLWIRDPFILPVAETGTYYMVDRMVVSLRDGGNRQGVGVYTSRDLEHWEGPKPVFHHPDGFWADGKIWAPEMHRYRDKYYVFGTFNASGKRAVQIVWSDSPEGPFKPFADEPHTPGDWFSLDGTLWVEEGVPYMVFCHEWVQVKDGTVELVRLKDDLSGVVGEPRTLFKASDAKWVVPMFFAKDSYVTDGPFLYRTRTGRLLMIWSSFSEGHTYTVGIASSASGKVTGPWKHMDEPLLAIDGGHGMIFRTFDGRLLMPIHQPNQGGGIRARFFELEDTGDTLRIVREVPMRKDGDEEKERE